MFAFSQRQSENARNGVVSWTEFHGLCLNTQCRRHVRAEEGIFCANFFATRGDFAPCEGCWCGPCYKPLEVRNFPVRKKLDKDGEVLEEEDKDGLAII
jgi:hypothetical protein